jgi:hypothetical protein
LRRRVEFGGTDAGLAADKEPVACALLRPATPILINVPTYIPDV